MKSILRLTAAGVALAALGVASNASAATGSAAARAEILSNLQIAAVASDAVMNFGQLTDNGIVGTANVVLTPLDVRTCPATVTCGGAVTPAAPSFLVTGFSGQTVGVTFPNATEQLDRSGGALGSMNWHMTVGTFTTSAATVTLSGAGGTGTFSIGGTLVVNTNQAPGVYTGAVNVAVDYN